MTQIENVVNESYSFDLVFLRENRFQEEKVDILPPKLTLNSENALFLLAHHSFNLQDIKISFEYVDSYAKLSLILDT